MKGWRTIIANVILALIAAWNNFFGGDPAAQIDPSAAQAHIDSINQALVFGGAVINMALRYLTTTPVGQKE